MFTAENRKSAPSSSTQLCRPCFYFWSFLSKMHLWCTRNCPWGTGPTLIKHSRYKPYCRPSDTTVVLMLKTSKMMFIARASVLHVPFCTGGAFSKGLQIINASLQLCVHYSYVVEKDTKKFSFTFSYEHLWKVMWICYF